MKQFIFVIAFFLIINDQAALANPLKFNTIPSTTCAITDAATGIPISVSVDKFLMSTTEITQTDFMNIMGYNPSFNINNSNPVENVTWWEAIRYCNLRSQSEGLQPCFDLSTGECDFTQNGYRLPTEAEWRAAAGNNLTKDPDSIHKNANIGSNNTKSVTALQKSLQEKGTTVVASYPPNQFGLFDMLGNVWEWCYDYFDPLKNSPNCVQNPSGPSWGIERVIKGGSFISTVTSWNKDFTSAIHPNHKSRFTGFRICKNTKTDPLSDKTHNPEWFNSYNKIPADYENKIGSLSSLLSYQGKTISTKEQWLNKRDRLMDSWSQLLGTLSCSPPAPQVKLIKILDEKNYTGKLMYLQTEPDFWEKIYFMIPKQKQNKPLPVIIVPYYDVDTPAGKNLGGRSFRPMGVRSFAYHMVQQGYIAVAIRWFGESYGESYDEAVANLTLKHPTCSGLGKWVWDAQRLVDYIYTMPEVDHQNIGIIGHSLGAKMALYAAAMDERITAVVASEGGIGFEDSNYDDYWYFGDYIRDIDKSINQHQLLGLIAPRPFLLIGGDAYDTDKSWYYINAARQVYDLFEKPQNIGFFNHRSGHTPTPEAVKLSVEWLKHFTRAEK